MGKLYIVVVGLESENEFAYYLFGEGLEKDIQCLVGYFGYFVGQDERNEVVGVDRVYFVYFRDELF